MVHDFTSHVFQINVALRASTPTSVVITDELDRGTSEISGLSLVAAVLNTFAERGTECPHVFAATHARPALALLARTPLIEIQVIGNRPARKFFLLLTFHSIPVDF